MTATRTQKKRLNIYDQENARIDSICEVAIVKESEVVGMVPNEHLDTLLISMSGIPTLDFEMLAEYYPNIRVLVLDEVSVADCRWCDVKASNVQRGLERMPRLEYFKCVDSHVCEEVDLTNVTAKHVNVDFPVRNSRHLVSYLGHHNKSRADFGSCRLACIGFGCPLPRVRDFRNIEVYGCPMSKIPAAMGEGPDVSLVVDLDDECESEVACVARLAKYGDRISEILVMYSNGKGKLEKAEGDDLDMYYDSEKEFETALREVCPRARIKFDLRPDRFIEDEVRELGVSKRIFERIDADVLPLFSF